MFKRVVSCSGSFWYPGFIDFIENNSFINVPDKMYLSLGDIEKESKNEFLKNVQDNTEEIYQFYKKQNINIKFVINHGGHFKDSNLRLAKGIKYIIE